ncbi:hypothetical protein MGYG_04062 [Nannizzia gypsea CBS 118893]|uniref:Serine protein kinase n=1 Tax=Arthroderma gypseum (strain ATCC MYA-4604 / CBS 118893) TaxID=535722 RepID=E4UUU2_ARTGP|nr:hypothetical protein MGYG_04062 [Nannizzia gypsea CBS 118893]EFR01059.1 hypothetical protein MGYG_04062 [Nannizzia gypsea CBS 118893]
MSWDPDTIKYPANDPAIVLSVSEDAYELIALKDPLALYVENAVVEKSIKHENASASQPSECYLFTHSLNTAGSATNPLIIGTPGLAGTYTQPNGIQGGVLEIYVQTLKLDAVKRLRLQAHGGHGHNQITGEPIPDIGKAGGDGGDGGKITIYVGSQFKEASDRVQAVLDKIIDEHYHWPADFTNDVNKLMECVLAEDVQKVHQMPPSMRTAEDVLKVSKESITHELIALLTALQRPEDELLAELSQIANVDGGAYGVGGKGKKEDGKNGKAGKEGTLSIIRAGDYPEICKRKVCFAHPIQCRMLLDKANLLWFCGTLRQKAQGVIILERILKRLEFLDFKPAQQSHAEEPLWSAYRAAEYGLFLTSGPKDEEPASIQQLRAIKTEAEAALIHIRSGDDYYGGKSGDVRLGARKVPRASFKFYQETAAYFVEYLAKAEDTYRKCLSSSKDEEAKREAVRKRISMCETVAQNANTMIAEAKKDLVKSGMAIRVRNEAIKPARERLEKELETVMDLIRKQFGANFQDLLDALGQVIFVHGSWPMVGLQGVELLNKGISQIESDTGVKVNKDYLIKKIHDISNTIESLDEGYNVLKKDGSLDLYDPGAAKLIILETETMKLLNEFSFKLGLEPLKEVKKRFDAYIDAVQKRNNAVLSYNVALALLLKYEMEIESLRALKGELEREASNLEAAHPTMQAFLKKLYGDSIQIAQLWLYKTQQAYCFVALNNENVIGKAMADFNFSSFDSDMLRAVHASLSNRYRDHTESMGQSTQVYSGLKYHLKERDVRILQSGGDMGVILDVYISTNPPTDGPDVFFRRADVRLTKVRFFAVGVSTSDDRLDVVITHSGKEAILDKEGTRYEFDHDPLVVGFKYDTTKMKAEGPDTSDGDIASANDDKYALVGPFTSWRIEILSESNKDLDLSDVSAAYFEFDFRYREMPMEY